LFLGSSILSETARRSFRVVMNLMGERGTTNFVIETDDTEKNIEKLWSVPHSDKGTARSLHFID